MKTASHCKALEALVITHRSASQTEARSFALSLCRAAAALTRLYTADCNDSEGYYPRQKTEQRIENRVKAHCAALGIKVVFNGDPRGYPIKLHFGPRAGEAQQPFNTWGGASDGWGVGAP